MTLKIKRKEFNKRSFNKQQEVISENEEKARPIFPVYLDTMRIKDTIAMLEDGIASMTSVTKDVTTEAQKSFGGKADVSLYKIQLGGNIDTRKNSLNKSNESYEKIHTDASLFYKVLEEFERNKRIKKIKNIDDVCDVDEGDIVLLEGKIWGNEIEGWFNKICVFLSVLSVVGNVDKKTMKQISGIRDILKNDERISTTTNMICQLDDGTELLTMIEIKNLVNDSGVELVRGKYKVLGVVFEKIRENEEIPLTRDTMLEIFKAEDLEKLYSGFDENLKGILNVPEIRRNIKGPSLGIIPIGIYL